MVTSGLTARCEEPGYVWATQICFGRVKFYVPMTTSAPTFIKLVRAAQPFDERESVTEVVFTVWVPLARRSGFPDGAGRADR